MDKQSLLDKLMPKRAANRKANILAESKLAEAERKRDLKKAKRLKNTRI